MLSQRTLSRLNILLAGFVIIGLFLSHLALTDIAHGIEPDLAAEWWIIRITFLLVILFASSTVYTFYVDERIE